MYDGSTGPARRGAQGNQLGGGGGSGKLLVSNLDFGVNDSDIQVIGKSCFTIRQMIIYQ